MSNYTLWSMKLVETDPGAVEKNTKEFIGVENAALIERVFELHSEWFKRLAIQGVALSDGLYQSVVLQLRLRNHLWTGWTLLQMGLLVDSVNAIKLAFETLYLAEHLKKQPATAQEWFESNLRVDPSTVRKSHPDGKDLGSLYAEICRVAHPNGVTFRWQLDRHHAQGDRYFYGQIFDPELIFWVLERLRPLLWASLAQFRGTLPPQRMPKASEDEDLMRLVYLSENKHFGDRLRAFKEEKRKASPQGQSK